MAGEEPTYYHYKPSPEAAIVFIVAFSLTTALHVFQLLRRRTWYFIPFVIGGAFEIAGFILRYISVKQYPDYGKIPYITQTSFILLAPALYAASIYMVLGRIILTLDAEHHSLIKRQRLTKLFVTGDVISFIVQGAGGPLMSSADSKSREDLGKYIIVGGLFVQIIIFGLFIAVTAIFHRRITLEPTTKSNTLNVPWRRYIFGLYAASVLIMVRSIFRVCEFIEGRDGVLMSKEVYFYVLDTMLMVFVSIVFNTFHPSTIIPSYSMDKPLLKEENSMESI
ncbi:Protein RTA1 [Paramyrothecium foliicola]|nr:Protein RTA1 [Paramyrothecium foliicola]